MYPNLKLQLWRTGMRQNRLAKTLGLDESLLSRIVNGFREPSPRLRKQIAALLDSDEQWLFDPAVHPAPGLPARPDDKSGSAA